MESAYALDFVSLLLSRHAFKQAETTISPFLKQNVPMGSLGTEILQLPQVSDSKNRDDDRVSTGWKQQSLHATQDSLIQAATRLEKDLERETDYWEQVLAVKEKGWSICRLPREKHTLGVRYGFLEGKSLSQVFLSELNPCYSCTRVSRQRIGSFAEDGKWPYRFGPGNQSVRVSYASCSGVSGYSGYRILGK